MTFDPEVFLNQETIESMETRAVPIPAGEYRAMVENVGIVEQGEDKSIAALLTWLVLDEAVKQELSLDRVTVTQRIFLDVNDNNVIENGQNRNISLGRTREALGFNTNGEPFSLKLLRGAGPAIIHVRHAPNKRNPDSPYINVVNVAAIPST